MTKWIEKDEVLTREFSFNNFREAVSFVNKVANLAEAQDHHPDILIHDYKNVLLTLSTHSVGKITEKDYNLAGLIDNI